MALQGTLDTFELPDVLRLLASTRKTGRLQLQSDRGDGSVWLADGQVVAVLTDGSPDGDIGDGLFDLLRAHEGGFAFHAGDVPTSPAPPVEVEPLLNAGEQRLAEWREIEKVVPSLHAWVSLAPELPQPEVSIDAATWRLVATVGGGLTVGELARALGLPEVPVCRVVRDLVVLGLGAVSDAPAQAASWETAVGLHARPDVLADLNGHDHRAEVASDEEPQPAAPSSVPAWDDPRPVAPEPSAIFTVDQPVGYGVDPEPPAPSYEPAYESPAPAPVLDEALSSSIDDDADEVARQLAMLSPRAAQAVAAAAAADNDADRDAALEALQDGDEPVNRGLLLKFLSSVKT